jgi:preprotein translocase subunit Sec61beta
MGVNMKIEGDKVFFNSGIVKYAFEGIISIYDDDKLVYGYDGTFAYLPGYWDEDEEDILTPDECVEIADYMIKQWQEFREKYINKMEG